jgi:SAM-dependent methyltransferase
LGEDVLEVGAGIGGTTQVLCRRLHNRWVCLEPDSVLIAGLKSESNLPEQCEIRQGSLANLLDGEYFDTILYIDVLEHIEDDFKEMQWASKFLKPGGVLIVLSPAHQWLFSAFDRSIGHYRRYTKSSLNRLSPQGLVCVSIKYLDSVGMLASLSNCFMKQRMPTVSQIQLWDSWMVPISRFLDQLLCYTVGKSILGIWRK